MERKRSQQCWLYSSCKSRKQREITLGFPLSGKLQGEISFISHEKIHKGKVSLVVLLAELPLHVARTLSELFRVIRFVTGVWGKKWQGCDSKSVWIATCGLQEFPTYTENVAFDFQLRTRSEGSEHPVLEQCLSSSVLCLNSQKLTVERQRGAIMWYASCKGVVQMVFSSPDIRGTSLVPGWKERLLGAGCDHKHCWALPWSGYCHLDSRGGPSCLSVMLFKVPGLLGEIKALHWA